MESSTAAREDVCLRDGDAYRASLRDGRAVWSQGERIDDVTEDPALGAGIDLVAETFDAQFDDELRDVTTFVDPDGRRVSRSWQIPTTVEDLQARRRLIEYTTLLTAGTYGRPPDFGPLIALGLLARKPSFTRGTVLGRNVDFAENIDRYFEFGRSRNLIAGEVLADPQADRSAGSAASAGLLRVVAAASRRRQAEGRQVGRLARRAGRRDHLHQPAAARLSAGGVHLGRHSRRDRRAEARLPGADLTPRRGLVRSSRSPAAVRSRTSC